MIYLRLFFEFFKTGLFAIGGGLATLPFLYDMGDRTGWFTAADVVDMVAIAESTPGPIGVNMATYVGFTTAGAPGAIIATAGLITPSIVIILLVAGFIKAFQNNKYFQAAFYGVRPASTGLIAAAGFSVVMITFVNLGMFGRTGALRDLFNIPGIIMAVALYILTNHVKYTKKLHPILFILLSAAAGIVLGLG